MFGALPMWTFASFRYRLRRMDSVSSVEPSLWTQISMLVYVWASAESTHASMYSETLYAGM